MTDRVAEFAVCRRSAAFSATNDATTAAAASQPILQRAAHGDVYGRESGQCAEAGGPRRSKRVQTSA